MAKKRKHSRKKTLYNLNIVNKKNPPKTARAVVVDISIGGSAFECMAVKFKKGKKVELRFVFSEKKVYVFGGTVKRVNEKEKGVFLHGVQFENIGLIDRVKLFILIHKISK